MTNILPENSARLIFKINKQPCILPDEVSILFDDDSKGYYWEWGSEKGKSFNTEKLALIDWIDWIDRKRRLQGDNQTHSLRCFADVAQFPV